MRRHLSGGGLAAVLAVSAIALSGCSTDQTKTGVAGLEVGLAGAETAAISYIGLPACGATTSKVCSDPAIVAKIKSADQTAYTTVKTAEATAAAGGAVDLTAATAAVTALQSLIPTAKVP